MTTNCLALLYPRDQEVWRPVLGREGEYEISSLGAVRSLPRMRRRAASPLFPNGIDVKWKGKVLAPAPLARGHMFVMLGRKDGRLVHRLMLEAFVGPCPDGMEGLHWNDRPSDNWIGNLRWGTRLENINDAFRNGGRMRSLNPDPRCGKRKRK